MDIQKTLLDIRRGFYASLFVLIATALMSILIFFSPSSLDTETIKAFQDNWIDAILIAFLLSDTSIALEQYFRIFFLILDGFSFLGLSSVI